TIFMCCFSGLYRISIENNVANATRISAENLPFQPTSMAIDREDRLYLATNDANSQLIEMDKVDGSWTVRQTFNQKINDLGSLPCVESELEQSDSDEDGIIDPLDDFPNDSEKSFTSFTPSKLGWGSIGFEDLWPAKGDFDFNDLVMNYRFASINNAQNQVVELDVKFQVKNIGASFQNGFGFQIPIDPNLIQSVTGFNHTEGLIQLNANGTEANQSQAVIIVFDNAFRNGNPGECNNRIGNEINIKVRFVNPISPESLGEAPFNPFIFVNGERSHEVHLADELPTDLADTSLFGTFNDDSDPSTQKYYKDELNHPWAINIIHNFRVPREKARIYRAYNRFQEWAQSGGILFTDWYKDNSGYRNTSFLCLD
ncbi:MAG: LruC domain-containing protein, partial [Bacteroidota bacterium]